MAICTYCSGSGYVKASNSSFNSDIEARNRGQYGTDWVDCRYCNGAGQKDDSSSSRNPGSVSPTVTSNVQPQGCIVGTLAVFGVYWLLFSGVSSWLGSPTSSNPQQLQSNPWDQVSPDDTSNPLSAHYVPPSNSGLAINLNRNRRNEFVVPAELDGSDIIVVSVSSARSNSSASAREYHDFCLFSSKDSSQFVALVRRAKQQQVARRDSVMSFTLIPSMVDEKGNALPQGDHIVPLIAQAKDTPLETYKIFLNEALDFKRRSGRK